jgi:hypothetical protein
MLAAGLALS